MFTRHLLFDLRQQIAGQPTAYVYFVIINYLREKCQNVKVHKSKSFKILEINEFEC